jgi:hypothetical protein
LDRRRLFAGRLHADEPIAAPLATTSVRTAELDNIQQENQDDKSANSNKRGHAASPEMKTSGAL